MCRVYVSQGVSPCVTFVTRLHPELCFGNAKVVVGVTSPLHSLTRVASGDGLGMRWPGHAGTFPLQDVECGWSPYAP